MENEEEGDVSVPACCPKAKLPMSQLCREWNRTAHIGYISETTKGWLKKTKDLRTYQGRALRRARPGTRALQEIRHYQRCQQFLMQLISFQRLVRDRFMHRRGTTLASKCLIHITNGY